MSIEMMRLIKTSDISPSGRKFVAFCLADYANEEGACFPSVSMIAQYTGQASKTVRDHLTTLEKDGFISRKRQRRPDGTLGRYEYVFSENTPVANLASGEKGQVAKNGQTSGEKGNKPVAKSAAHRDQLTTNEPSNINSPRKILETVLDADRANDVLEHRQRLRKPLSKRAAELLVQEFAQCANPNDAADEMVVSGWQGFKAAWLENRKVRQPQGHSMQAALAKAAGGYVDG